MPKEPRITRTRSKGLADFYKASRRAFGQEYRTSGQPSVLVAQNKLEDAVEHGVISPADATNSINNPETFAKILRKEEREYQNDQNQLIHERMSALEHNTDWKVAAGVSLGAGMVTGLVFAVVGPFLSALLQPTADELLKHRPAAQTPAAAQPYVENITNNYNFGTPIQPSPERKVDSYTPRTAMTCKSVAIEAYKASLQELLRHGNVVSLNMNGKKVSLCYRPNVQSGVQKQVLAKR